MDFEWDTAKEQTNRKKHGVDFRTAAKVFLDPYVIEFDDPKLVEEPRFNAIGIVDGRVLFVSYP
ncbi:MAG: BrnT family toxin [Alphaproteobacteria bacterium]|nr:BrnT family toxin [Alphaproteobacteria bacterium]MBV8411243.1 BrnT family toxin [Alphaproteobacteria bacterium]